MRVALVQFAASRSKAENTETLDRLLGAVAAQRPDLVICPEASMVDFGPPEAGLGDLAEPLDGPFVETLSTHAARLDTVIIAGMFESPGHVGSADSAASSESAEAGRVYNTLVCLGPDGGLLATYRKLHLYDAFGYAESDRLLPGDGGPVTVDIGGQRVGLATCYDLRFPELTRALAADGAELLAIPAAFVRGPMKEDHWQTLVRARAIENTCYVAAAAQTGPTYCGRSMLVDPLGVVTASLGEQVGWCVGEAEAERVRTVREVNPTLEHRRFQVVRWR